MAVTSDYNSTLEMGRDEIGNGGLCASFGSTYSTATNDGDREQSGVSSVDTAVLLDGLKESAPLLFKGTSFAESPSPIQSWRAVLAELRGPQRLWVVVVSAIVASMCALLAGYTLGYPSKAVIDLRAKSFNNSLLQDLFGALAPFGAIFGGGMAGWTSESFGRKPTLVFSCVPNFIGWFLLSSANCLIHSTDAFRAVVYLGRFFSGVGMGWSMLTAPMYIAEISPPLLRGLFSAVPQLGLALGVLLVYCIEALHGSNFAYTALAALIITVVFGCASLFLLETPRYLVKKGKIDEALSNLGKLRGIYVDIQIELEDTITVFHRESNLPVAKFFHELKKKSVIIPLILLLFILSFQQLSGINALIFYAAPIFEQSHASSTQFTALLAIGITEVVTTCLTVFIIDLFGRKLLLVISCLVMCIGCLGLGTHLFLVKHQLQDNATSYLAVVSVILVILGFSLGLGAIPWTLIAEIVPLRMKGSVGGIVSAVNWFFAAVVTGTYLDFSNKAGEYNAWWTFAALNLSAAMFVAIFLPETKGKTLEVIEKQIQTRYRLCSWK